MGVGELPVESRFANAGLAHDGHHLTPPGPDLLQGLTELVQFAVAAHKAREAARHGGLQPRADRSCPDEFMKLHWIQEPLHWHSPSGLDLDITLSELKRRGSKEDGSRISQLLHPRRQVCRLT